IDMVETIEQKFQPLAENKGIIFRVSIGEDVSQTLNTDGMRLKQIINNLLSNAFKFTSEGEVKLTFNYPTELNSVDSAKDTLQISVLDTGIGISKNKQESIFGAFQQADGTTSRRYGGTGLGLSISRQLAKLLGGELRLTSEENKGSIFTFYLPQKRNTGVQNSYFTKKNTQDVISNIETLPEIMIDPTPEIIPEEAVILDDRETISEADKSILIIEDDQKFLYILLDLAQEKGFKCLVAQNGKSGLQLAEQYKPNAIILDVGLPQIDGWTVME
ncbi:MAG: response regulator, partial [Proteobacteria bacterium]|nr:response regulator [Pseudomonadota bacterium]